eukprot:5816792-Pyramimonas_sp.AAC.1
MHYTGGGTGPGRFAISRVLGDRGGEVCGLGKDIPFPFVPGRPPASAADSREPVFGRGTVMLRPGGCVECAP